MGSRVSDTGPRNVGLGSRVLRSRCRVRDLESGI